MMTQPTPALAAPALDAVKIMRKVRNAIAVALEDVPEVDAMTLRIGPDSECVIKLVFDDGSGLPLCGAEYYIHLTTDEPV
jgi:hypothetical protein